MKKYEFTDEELDRAIKIKLSSMCAFCEKELLDNEPAFSLNIVAKVDMTKYRGIFFPLFLLNKTIVPAFVVPEDSQAFEDGYDMVIMCCSENCAEKLKTNLNADIFTVKQIEDANRR